MQIILIEPDSILAQLYIVELERAGHGVRYVRSAESAIRIADRKRPDLVILELQLTDHNGIAFLQEFRSYADWVDIPVFVHTVIPLVELQPFTKALQEMGVKECLYKPQTSLRRLVSAVEEYSPIAA